MKKQTELSECTINVQVVNASTIVEIVWDVKVLNQIYNQKK